MVRLDKQFVCECNDKHDEAKKTKDCDGDGANAKKEVPRVRELKIESHLSVRLQGVSPFS